MGPTQTVITTPACRKVGPDQAVTPAKHTNQVEPDQADQVGPDQAVRARDRCRSRRLSSGCVGGCGGSWGLPPGQWGAGVLLAQAGQGWPRRQMDQDEVGDRRLLRVVGLSRVSCNEWWAWLAVCRWWNTSSTMQVGGCLLAAPLWGCRAVGPECKGGVSLARSGSPSGRACPRCEETTSLVTVPPGL